MKRLRVIIWNLCARAHVAHDEATLQMLMTGDPPKRKQHKLQRRRGIRVIPETSPDDRIDSAVLEQQKKKRRRKKKKRRTNPESQRSGRYINYE